MGKAKVLIIEDEEAFQESLREALGERIEILFASSGKEGLAQAQQQQVDLILLDLQLPDLSGFHVLRLLKMSPQTVSIPVVVISARADTQALLEAEHLGALDYLIKPSSWTEVREIVLRCLPSGGSFS